MTFAPGDTLLDKYRIETLLGQGSYGDVYLVTYLPLNQPRALKVLRRAGATAQEFEKAQGRFTLEAQLGGQLNSPNPNPHLLMIYDPILNEEMAGIVMEYAPGGSLAKRIQPARGKAEPLPVMDALQIALDVAEGLAALHDREVIHRDLKPANILFDQHGHARLADLGLVQTSDDSSHRLELSKAQPHPGTPGYMSPEQETSTNPLKPPSDIYALGLVLFEMLTGKLYYNQRPGTRASKLRADLPAALDDLLARMLAKDPEKRPWDGAEAAGELRKLQAGALAEQARRQAAQQAQAETDRQTAAARAEALAREQSLARQKEEAQKQAEFLEEQRRKAEIARQEASAREKALALERREQELARVEAEARARRQAEQEKQVKTIAASRPVPQEQGNGFLARSWGWMGLAALLLLCGCFVILLLAIRSIPAAPPAPTAVAILPGLTATIARTPIPSATALPLSPTSTPIPSVTALPTSIPAPTTQVRQKDGMTMVYVPGATFTMGSADYSDAAPHQVTLSAYWIDQTDVTNAMFKKFVTDQNYTTDAEKAGKSNAYNPAKRSWDQVNGADWQHPQGPTSSLSGLDQHPVVNVSWNDDAAYCAWAGAGLPSEAQWELAARGTDGRAYPWGNRNPDGSLVNFADKNLAGANWADQTIDDHYEFTSPVGSYPAGASPYGVLDMAGNVWQWVADWYDGGYYGESRNPIGPASGQYRMLRGGSWGSRLDATLRSAHRGYREPAYAAADTGFRCARSN